MLHLKKIRNVSAKNWVVGCSALGILLINSTSEYNLVKISSIFNHHLLEKLQFPRKFIISHKFQSFSEIHVVK